MNTKKDACLTLSKLTTITGLILFTGFVWAKNYLYTPDGRAVPIKAGVTQPDLSQYRSPIESKVVDRRFYTNDATFMANEQFKMGMEGWNDMVKAAMPVSYRRAFQWVVARETYMYARNLLDYVGGRTHSGVHMVQGPYWTMKALRHTNFNRLQRNRGERVFSNKDVMLGFYLPLVYQRTGFPRVFDDIQLSYLQYASVDPRFVGKLDNTDSYVDPMSGKKGGWGVTNTYFNDYPQRFDHDKMDTTFDLGAMGQFLKRRSQWIDRFYQSSRIGEVEGSHELTELLGNDAEEGMRGWGLSMGSVNVLLQVKASMFSDGKKLVGINPKTYEPENGLRYIPHQIKPDILWVGDMPERLWGVSIKDNSSQLWDQASWLWGTSAFAIAVHRRNDIFTANPPVDGGMVEKDIGALAEALGNSVLKNMAAMHVKNGVLVSEWTPKDGTGNTVTMRDLTMSIVALHDYEQSWKLLGRHQKMVDKAIALLTSNADFVLKVQEEDGSFHHAYEVGSGKALGGNTRSVNQWEGVRALIAAYYSTENEAYLVAARKTFNYVNEKYWIEKYGVYRTAINDDTVVVEPYSSGITLGAMREMLFASPAHIIGPQVERITRWWIQTIDQSGSMQAETKFTGEIFTGFGSKDDDADGIPFVSAAHGNNGSAPLIAGKVLINIGGKTNQDFYKTKGDLHDANKFSKVKMSYVIHSPENQKQIFIPVEFEHKDKFVERKPMQREDGTTIPLQAALVMEEGLGSVNNLTGKQIFDANCSICHGEHGEGIDGKNLGEMMNFPQEIMFHVVQNGRFEKSMPPWGIGNDDGYGGTLKKDEIDRIIAYVQSETFRTNHANSEAGKIIDGQLPKDVWFYLSRENVKTKGKHIAKAEDAMRIINLLAQPQNISANWWENIRIDKPDELRLFAIKYKGGPNKLVHADNK